VDKRSAIHQGNRPISSVADGVITYPPYESAIFLKFSYLKINMAKENNPA